MKFLLKMFFSLKIKSIFALLIFSIDFYVVCNGLQWVNHVVKYITNDATIFRTVLIIDTDIKSHYNIITEILNTIQQNVPSQIITFKNDAANSSRAFLPKLLNENFQRGTFIIMIWFAKNDFHVSESAEYLINSMGHAIRPKFLMIALSTRRNLNYRKLFHFMWTNYFLDCTVLEITVESIKNDVLYWNHRPTLAIMHYHNPFTDKYTKQNYVSRVQLFPNKLQNLNGFKMQVGSFNFKHFVHVKRNSSGHTVDVSGAEALLLKTISEKMNFKLSEVQTKNDSFGRGDCVDINQATDLSYLLSHNEIRFITNQGACVANCGKLSMCSKSVGNIKVCALIPVLSNQNNAMSLNLKWIYLISLLLIIWIITKFLKFDRDIFSCLEILQVMLGFSIPREPQRIPERITFISILIAFTIFSSNIFAIITDMKLAKKTELRIETLEELLNSNLIPMMENNYAVALKHVNDSINEGLLRKSRILGHKECIDVLLKQRNVACIIRDTIAEIEIQDHRDKDGKPQMEIVKQSIGSYIKVMYYEPSSPYGVAIDKVIAKLIECGLIIKWSKLSSLVSNESKELQAEKNLEPDTANILVNLHILSIFAVGYVLSITIFTCEIIVKSFQKSI